MLANSTSRICQRSLRNKWFTSSFSRVFPQSRIFIDVNLKKNNNVVATVDNPPLLISPVYSGEIRPSKKFDLWLTIFPAKREMFDIWSWQFQKFYNLVFCQLSEVHTSYYHLPPLRLPGSFLPNKSEHKNYYRRLWQFGHFPLCTIFQQWLIMSSQYRPRILGLFSVWSNFLRMNWQFQKSLFSRLPLSSYSISKD